MSWRAEKDELVAANGDFEQPLFVWMKRQRAEVEAALLYFDRNLSRGHAAHIDRDIRVARAKPSDERQQRVDRRFVGANQHAPAAEVAQLAHRGLGSLRETHEPLAVVLKHFPGVGQRPGL